MSEFVPLPQRDDDEEIGGRARNRVFLAWLVIVATVAVLLSIGQISDKEEDSGSAIDSGEVIAHFLLRIQAQGFVGVTSIGAGSIPEELEETFAALADGLARIDFYKARKPEAVMRTLRTIVTRAEPDLREARLLAAVGYEIGNYLDRKP